MTGDQTADNAPTTDCPHCGRTAKDCDGTKARGWGNCCIRCEAGGRVETHRLRAVTTEGADHA